MQLNRNPNLLSLQLIDRSQMKLGFCVRERIDRKRDDEDTHRLAHAQVFAFAARPCRRVGNATRSSEHVYCTNTCRKKSVYLLPGVVVRVDVKTGFTPVTEEPFGYLA